MDTDKRFSSSDVMQSVETRAARVFRVLSRDCGFPIDYEDAARRLALDVCAFIEGDIDYTYAPWRELGVFHVKAQG